MSEATQDQRRVGITTWILEFFAAAGSAVLLGCIAAWAIVWAFFSNTRSDGVAVLIISFLAAGLTADVLVFAWLARKMMKRIARVWTVAATPWLFLACFATWMNAKENYIDWTNWRWILFSGDWQAETRRYVLNWIIRGWVAVLCAALLSFFVARAILSRSQKYEIRDTEYVG